MNKYIINDIMCVLGGFVMLVVDQCEVMCMMFVAVGVFVLVVDSVLIDFKVNAVKVFLFYVLVILVD